jgi:hypothetical protein
MRRRYPAAVTWFMLATLGIAFLFLIIWSPVHRENDPVFWFIFLTAVGLVFLVVILHHEKSEEERERFIRVFFLADWVLGVTMAGYVVWKHVKAGTFW